MNLLIKYNITVNFIYFIVQCSPPPWWCGGGGTTPGAPASPIDDYIIYLAIVGLFVIYYTYKKSNRLVKN
jgi:hypothetical protein